MSERHERRVLAINALHDKVASGVPLTPREEMLRRWFNIGSSRRAKS